MNTDTQFDILDALAREIERVQTGQAVTTTGKAVTAAEVRAHLRRYDFAGPVPLDDLFEDVARMLREWNVQMNHPRYLGLFNPNTTLASVVADALVAVYNPQLPLGRTPRPPTRWNGTCCNSSAANWAFRTKTLPPTSPAAARKPT
jgi:hypothetical protein